jgi:hypothetical protein
LVPGGWLPGSSDAALDWRVAVCDPPFQVSLAVRTGRQHSGENALLVRMNPESPVPAASSPYAAIENRTQLPVHEGELWDVRAFVRTSQNVEPVPGLVRGAYVFLRLVYDDGSTQDIRTEPLMEPTENYVETTQVLKISESPPGRVLTYATLWLYVWIVNADPVEIPAGYFGQWEVLFDDISCERA